MLVELLWKITEFKCKVVGHRLMEVCETKRSVALWCSRCENNFFRIKG